MNNQEKRILELKAQYRVLSEIEDLFPKNSVHPVAKQVDKKITETIKQLETLDSGITVKSKIQKK
jgi:hypothetical protein